MVQIGFGNIGMRRTLITGRHPGVEVAGVVDVKPRRLHLAQEILGERCLYETDYIRALQRVRPDAVIISTPNHLHGPMTLTAVNGGAHVLCEKPLATNAAVAGQCVARAKKKGVKL